MSNFTLNNLIRTHPSKCQIEIPCLTSLKNNALIDYIDKNLIDIVKDYKIDSVRIRIRWEYKMFNNMSLEDCWKYAYELMYYIFEFRKLFNKIFLLCSFSTYAGKGNNKNGINYGMPIIHVLLIHDNYNNDVVNMLMNFIKRESKFETIYNFPVTIKDPCLIFKYMFCGNGHKYIISMIPDNCTMHWYSSIENLSSFMRVITNFNKNKIRRRINSKELKFE
jgi:hypothetical protein